MGYTCAWWVEGYCAMYVLAQELPRELVELRFALEQLKERLNA